MTNSKKYGFTLVELAIVLVIIGLLIGGILAAQSMVQTAKIQKVVKQIGQYDAVIANFITKYNQIPGDSNKFPPNAGDNNGTTDIYSEIPSAWWQLSKGVGLKNYANQDYGVFAADGVATPITRSNCPRFDLDQFNDTSIARSQGVPCLQIAWIIWPYGTIRGLYTYRNGNTYDAPAHAPLKPIDALAIDKKLDNGIGGSGVGGGGPNAGKVFSSTPGTITCTNGSGEYDVSLDSYECLLFIQIGIANGVNGK